MLFNSYSFIFVFLPISVLGYWIIKTSFGPIWAATALAVASYIFYLISEPNYPLMLLGSIIFNLILGHLIANSAGKAKSLITSFAIIVDLLILAYFKYFSLILLTLKDFSLFNGSIPTIPLPAGISFYTFTQIAFLVDCYARKVTKFNTPSYFLFVTLFPHLIAGPILHHKEMVSQFEKDKRFSLSNHLLAGLIIFTIGLSKKTIIADSVSPLATAIFASAQAGHQPGFIEAWVGSLAYSVQIYFDFSGYSDMAIGIALMLGIRLPVNFNSPYKATSIVDFWRRWHITLSRFLRDYLYIALGGSRRGSFRRYLNLLITMTLGGLWHGASWTFAVWGAAHGFALIVTHAWDAVKKRFSFSGIPKPFALISTFLLVVFLWVPFRAESFDGMWKIWGGMTGQFGLGLPHFNILQGLAIKLNLTQTTVPFNVIDLFTVAGAILIAFFAPNTQEIMARYKPGLDSPGYHAISKPSHFSIKLRMLVAVAFGILLGVAVGFISPQSEFIYFRF